MFAWKYIFYKAQLRQLSALVALVESITGWRGLNTVLISLNQENKTSLNVVFNSFV